MRTILLLTALTVAATPLVAQLRNERRGFWFNVGVGGGSTGITCPGCSQNRTQGTAIEVRLGGALSRHVLLGGDLAGWGIRFNNVDQSISSATLALLWYPRARGAFFMKAGVGYMRYSYTDFNRWTNPPPLGSPVQTIDDAGAIILGAGYEIRFSRNTSLTPFINFVSSGDVKRSTNMMPGNTAIPEHRDLVQAGIGLTFH